MCSLNCSNRLANGLEGRKPFKSDMAPFVKYIAADGILSSKFYFILDMLVCGLRKVAVSKQKQSFTPALFLKLH